MVADQTGGRGMELEQRETRHVQFQQMMGSVTIQILKTKSDWSDVARDLRPPCTARAVSQPAGQAIAYMYVHMHDQRMWVDVDMEKGCWVTVLYGM